MEERQKLILRLLALGRPVSLFALEECTGASSEDLLEDLRDLAAQGYENGYELTADDDGYRLTGTCGRDIRELTADQAEPQPGRREELAAGMLLEAMLHERSVSLKTLKEILSLNDVELRFLVPSVTRTAAAYNVKALFRRRTLAVQGKEQDLRILAAALFRQSPLILHQLPVPSARQQDLSDHTDRLLQEHGLMTGKAERTCLQSFLLADLMRIHQGIHVNACSMNPPAGKETALIEDLAAVVQNETGLTFTRAEKTFLALRLAALAETVPDEQALHDDIDAALAAMDEIYGIHLSKDALLKKELDACLPSLCLRIRLGCIPQRPYREQVSRSFPFACELAETVSIRIAAVLGIAVAADEQAWLALIFQKALMRRKPQRKLRVLLVSPLAARETALLSMQIKERFRAYLADLFVCDDMAFIMRRPKLYDLVIAACDLPHDDKVPWCTIGPVLSEADILALRHFFERIP